jgi:hypothetical protein
MALHVLVVAATVQPHWLPYLALPALAGAGVAAVWGLWLLWGACRPVRGAAKAPLQADAPMFKLRDVVLITLLLTTIQVGGAVADAVAGRRRHAGGRLAGRPGRCACCHCCGADARWPTERRGRPAIQRP